MVRFHTLETPAVVRLQETYVRKVVDTVNDLGNVLYDVCSEPSQESYEWCVHFCKFNITDPREPDCIQKREQQLKLGLQGLGPAATTS